MNPLNLRIYSKRKEGFSFEMVGFRYKLLGFTSILYENPVKQRIQFIFGLKTIQGNSIIKDSV